MAITITINGVAKGLRSFAVSAAQNERDRATGVLISEDGTDQPTIDDVLAITEDSELLFAGSLKVPTLGAYEEAEAPCVATQFSALDFNELADRRIVTITFPLGTKLKAAATLLLPYLPGVSISSAWATDGPELPELAFTDASVETVLAKLTEVTGWLRNINYDKTLEYFEAGTKAAAWNIDDDNVVGNPTKSTSRLDYGNHIILKYSDAARKAYAFLKVTDNFSDTEEVNVGNQTYVFQGTLSDVAGHVQIGASYTASLNNLIAAINLSGGGGYAASTVANGSVTASLQFADMLKVTALAAGAAGNSIGCTTTAADADWVSEGNIPTDHLALGADESVSNRVTADDAAEQILYGQYDKLYEAPNIFAEADAQAYATLLLATAKVLQETFTYDTYRSGLFPGRTQSIVWTPLGFNQSCLIESISHRHVEGSRIRRTVSAVSGTLLKNNKWREQYRKWGGTSGSGTVVASGSTGGGTTNTVRIHALGASSESFGYVTTAGTYIPILNFVPVYVETAFNAKIRAWVKADAAGVTVTVKLMSSVDGVTWPGTVVTTLPTVTSQTSTPVVSSTVALQQGLYYRLEYTASSNDQGVACTAYMEQTV